MRLKKWLFPVVSVVIILIVLVLFYLAAEPHSHDTGYGGVIIMLNGILFCVALVIPVLSVLYSKKCLSDSEHKYYFTLYNSLMLTLPFISMIAPIIFAWCEIWSLIGLIRKKTPEKGEIN